MKTEPLSRERLPLGLSLLGSVSNATMEYAAAFRDLTRSNSTTSRSPSSRLPSGMVSPLTWNQFQTLRGLVEEIPWPPSVESLELTREIFLGEHPTASEMTWFRSGLDPRVVSAVEELIRFKGGGPLSRELLNASLRADLTHERCAHLLACSRRSVFTKVLDVEEKLSWEAVFDWACGEVELFIGSNPSRTELRKYLRQVLPVFAFGCLGLWTGIESPTELSLAWLALLSIQVGWHSSIQEVSPEIGWDGLYRVIARDFDALRYYAKQHEHAPLMDALLLARKVSSDVLPTGGTLQWDGDYQVPDVVDFLLDNELLGLLTRQKFLRASLISELITNQISTYRKVALKARAYRRKTLHNLRVVLRHTMTSAVELGLVKLSKAELSDISKSLHAHGPLYCGKLTKLGPVMPMCVRDVLGGVLHSTRPLSPLRTLVKRAALLDESCQRIVQGIILAVVEGTENAKLRADIKDVQRTFLVPQPEFIDRVIMTLRGPALDLNWSDADVKEAIILTKRLGSRSRRYRPSVFVRKATTPTSTTPKQTTYPDDSPPPPLNAVPPQQRLRISTRTSLAFASRDVLLGSVLITYFRTMLSVPPFEPPFENLRSLALTDDSSDPPPAVSFLKEFQPLNPIPCPQPGTFEGHLYDDILCAFPPSVYPPLSTGQLNRLLEEYKHTTEPSKNIDFHQPCVQFLTAFARHGLTPSTASQLVQSDLAFMLPPGLFFLAQESITVRNFLTIMAAVLQSALAKSPDDAIEDYVSKYCIPAARWLAATSDAIEGVSIVNTFKIIAAAMCRCRTHSVLVDVSLWWVAALATILYEPLVPLLRNGTSVQMDEASRKTLALSFFRVGLVQLSLAAQGAALKTDAGGAWIGLSCLGVNPDCAPVLRSLPTPVKLDLDKGFVLPRKLQRDLERSSPGKSFSCKAVSAVMVVCETTLTGGSADSLASLITRVTDLRHENAVLCNLLALHAHKNNPPRTSDPTGEARLLDFVRTGSPYLSELVSNAAQDHSLPADVRAYLQEADPITTQGAYWEQIASNQVMELDSTAAMLEQPGGGQRLGHLLVLVSVIATVSSARESVESTISLFPSISFRDWTQSLDFLVVCATRIRCHPRHGRSVLHKALDECMQFPMRLHYLPWLTHYPAPIFLFSASRVVFSLLNLTAVMMDCAGRWIEQTKPKSFVRRYTQAEQAFARCIASQPDIPHPRQLCVQPNKMINIEPKEERSDSKSESHISEAEPSKLIPSQPRLIPSQPRLKCHPVRKMSPLLMTSELSIGHVDIYANWSPISCQGWGSNIDQQRDALPKPLVDPLPPYRPELPPRLLGDVVEPTPNLVIPDKPGQDMGVMFKRLLVGPLVLKPDRWAVIPRFKLECCSVWCPRYFRNDDAVLGLMHSMLAQGGLPRFTCSRIVVSLGQSDHPHTTSRSTTQTEPTLIIAELLFDGSVRRRIFGMLSPGSFSAAFTEDMGWFVSRVLQFPTLVEKVLDPGWMNFTPKPQPMQLLSSGCFHALLTLFESSKRLPLLPMWLLQRVFKQLESMSKVEILTAALASDYSSNVLPKRQEFDFSSKYGLGLTDGANVDNIFWTGGAPEAQTYRGLTDLQINRLFLLYAHFLLSYPEEYSLRMPRTRLKFPYFEQAFAEQLTKEINGNKELIRTWLQVIVLLLKRTPSIFKLVEKQPTPL